MEIIFVLVLPILPILAWIEALFSLIKGALFSGDFSFGMVCGSVAGRDFGNGSKWLTLIIPLFLIIFRYFTKRPTKKLHLILLIYLLLFLVDCLPFTISLIRNDPWCGF